MTGAPAFSIVIAAYNAERTLAAALASVERQTDPDFEVVIVDDGSTDGTGALAERLAAGRPYRVVHQPNRGMSAARNAGLALARGRWVSFLDSDDWYLPGYLAAMRRLLTDGADPGLAFCDAWSWDEGARRFMRAGVMAPYRPDPVPVEHWALFEALTEANFVFTAAAAPRELLERLGGFNEALRASEDWELWLRIAATGRRVAGTDARLAVYRRSAGQLTRDVRRMQTGMVDALRSVRDRCALPDDVARRLDDRIARAAAAVGARPGRLPPALSRAVRPLRDVRDYRLSSPRDVVVALPELRRR